MVDITTQPFGDPMVEMPKYRCHKEVWALQIESITLEGEGVLIQPAEPYAAIWKSIEWFTKHQPRTGGYYVVYADGYASYSPAQAFEEGYTRMESV